MSTLRPCGTTAAYRRHLRHREVPCDACRDAERARGEAARRAAGAAKRPPLQPCGTAAGYARHRKHREPACRPCLDANTAKTVASRHAARRV